MEGKRKLFYNGPIVTMDEGGKPQAVLTEGSRILAAGSFGELREMAGPGAELRDLEGHTLMPAFIDPHSHFTACANSFLEADLEGADSFDAIERRLRKFAGENPPASGQWLRGGKYDQNELAEGRHPTRAVLDQACPDCPAVISHQSGHMGVFNTKALKLLGVTGDTIAPEGGVIAMENGEPTGYMEEAAFVQYLQKVPMPAPQDFLKAYERAQEMYFSYGITTAQEGMMTEAVGGLYRLLLASGLLKLDVTAYADLKAGHKLMEEFQDYTKGYRQHFRVGGYKMFLDGSPQGRTAWLRRPYERLSQGGSLAPGGSSASDREAGYRGYPVLDDETVYRNLKLAASEGRQILTHCNGDAACGQLLAQCERVEKEGLPLAAVRPVMVHAQMLGADQMDELKRLGVIPSFFVAHVYHWGEIHVKNLGLFRAGAISPAATALKKEILFTFHQDSPVIRPDMMETVWCAVNRRTKSGRILGETERIPVYEALKAVTVNGAYQYFEEETKGMIAPGKTADLMILEENPLTAEPEALKDIRVLETMKEGETVYRRK